MKLKELLYIAESKSVGVVYHFTTLEGAKNIIDSGYILSNYGISTTRNFQLSTYKPSYSKDELEKLKRLKPIAYNSFHHSMGYVVRFALNGNKLSNEFKITPVLGGTTTEPTDKRMSRKAGENEEFINTTHIDIRKYVIAIDFLLTSKSVDIAFSEMEPKIDSLGIKTSGIKKWLPLHEDNVFITNTTEYLIESK